MNAPFSNIPWNTTDLWDEANTSLAATIGRHGSMMADARRQAHRTRQLLDAMAAPMDRLCHQTCPDCTDVCCRRAWVWADFKDLLYFHLAGIVPPEQQLLGRQGDHCRYAGSSGCRLDRIQRPFVCTWYLCPTQTRLLGYQPVEKQHLSTTLQRIKNRRWQMETAFIRALT